MAICIMSGGQAIWQVCVSMVSADGKEKTVQKWGMRRWDLWKNLISG